MSKEITTINTDDLKVSLANVSQGNVKEIAAVLTGLANLTINNVSDIGNVKADVKNNTTDIEQLKFNTEITDEQSSHIKTLVQAKVRSLVGYPSIYYKKVISDLYKHLKKDFHMGSKITTTKKGNYDSVLEGIRLYNPDIQKMKLDHDNYLIELKKEREAIEDCLEKNNEK